MKSSNVSGREFQKSPYELLLCRALPLSKTPCLLSHPPKPLSLGLWGPRHKPPPVKPELQQTFGAALHPSGHFSVQSTGAASSCLATLVCGRWRATALQIRKVHAHLCWAQDEGQTSSPHSALSRRQSSCLAGLALFSPAAAKMLCISEILAHNRDEIKGVIKKPQIYQTAFCYPRFLTAGSAEVDKPCCIRSSFM